MTIYNVYCDESRHTSDPSQPYIVIGALQCPKEEKRRLVGRLHGLMSKHGIKTEFGWKKVSPNRAEFYRCLIHYRTSAGIHDGGFSKRRARRILWIKEALALSAGTVQRYSQSRTTDRGKTAKRRTLVVVEEKYVVVFDAPRRDADPHWFVTAFPADQDYLEKIKRTSFLVETKKGGGR